MKKAGERKAGKLLMEEQHEVVVERWLAAERKKRMVREDSGRIARMECGSNWGGEWESLG
ncbi:hypothetical protein AMTR_s00028p00139110 [Amborella trichopoda]|uniref:Uncharacterized protein n=1 Tax=Amborella trichopoda TaxID=13333 RepID=W1PRY1_AMBTC|nr:hypothetical protein AMTR_s00028p00139110 [Amborella trichopoda]